MNEKDPSTAEVFLERIELYHELGKHLVSSLVAEANDPLAELMDPFEPVSLSRETVKEMSAGEYFKYLASCISLELREMADEDIHFEVERGREKLNEFVQLFGDLYPEHRFSSVLSQDKPVSELLDSGNIEPLLVMVEETPFFDVHGITRALNLGYLSETGELAEIRNIPETDRLKAGQAKLDRVFNSRSFLFNLINDHVSDGVFDDMVEDGLIDNNHPFSSIDISYSEEQPRKASLQIIYKAINQKMEKLGLFIRVAPRELFSIGGRGLSVSQFNHVAMKRLGNDSYKQDIEIKTFAAGPEMESFALSCLLKALDRVNKLSRLPVSELRTTIGM